MMRTRTILLFLFLFGLLPLPARGQDIREVTFVTQPRGAKVYLLVSGNTPYLLCRGGEPFPLDLSRFKGYGFDVRCEAPGYLPSSPIHIQSTYFNDLKKESRYPRKGAIILTPTIPVIIPLYTFVVENALVSSVALAAFIASIFTVILPWRRKIKAAVTRAARWEAIRSEMSEEDPLIAVKLGNYRLVEKLGQGGMGVVYRAVPDDTLKDEESVAVKIIKPEALKDEEFVKRFRREVSITGKLHHPSILKVIDCGENEKTMYMVMELVKGTELKARLKGGGLSLTAFWQLYEPVLDAVEYAHTQGIVHRDLKPENIMITEKGRIVVMDFGLARGEQYSNITLSGNALGTPSYMAPEQITGSTQDARSDQYSLGIIAWEMLAGKKPFDDENTINIILKHLNEPPPLLRNIRRDISESLEAVIMQMLSKEPEARLTSLREVREKMYQALRTGTPR